MSAPTTKRAPGPWFVSEPVDMGPMGQAWDVRHANGETYSTTNDLKHAKLTAAGLNQAWSKAGGPDLLALALRVAEHFHDTDSPLGVAAFAAIAKATGQATT